MPQTLTYDVWTYRDPALATSLNKQRVRRLRRRVHRRIDRQDRRRVVRNGQRTHRRRHRSAIFGKKVMLPVGVLRNVDHENEKVFVNRTKDEIKTSPEFDDTLIHDKNYRTKLSSYHGLEGSGYRDV